MLKKTVLTMFIVVLISGCTQKATTDSAPKVETTLQTFQGIGVLDFSPIRSELAPGASTYLKLRIRNNALGQTAENVVVKIDGLGLYMLLDCMSNPIPTEELDTYHSKDNSAGGEAHVVDAPGTEHDGKTCGELYGVLTNEDELYLYDLDKDLTVIEHGISRLFKGDEYEFYWGLIAPSNALISGIYYKQNIYYNVKYDYSSDNYFNVVAISSEEYERRRNMGESTEFQSDSTSTAGPIQISQEYSTLEFPSVGQTSLEYSLVLNVLNIGDGIIAGDNNVVKLDLPEGIEVTSNCDNWWGQNCATEEGVAPEDKNPNPYLEKTLTAEDLVGGYNLQVPFKLSETELKKLRDNNIPIKTYTFGVEMNYTYSLEGSGVISTKPFG